MAKKQHGPGNMPFPGLPGKLMDLSLLSCSASRPATVGKKLPPLQQSMKIEGGQREGHPNEIKALLTFALRDQKDDADGFQIIGKFGVTFKNAELPFSEEEVETIVKRVSVLVVWPYWREFVQSTTTRMGLPPLRVPLINPMYLSLETIKAPKRKRIGKPQKTDS
ncbi:MAG TPA: hypothetical protein VFI31_09810 [Pirellulales bacterium]|nr:hypothetical protein [Pirellulales bacterium]